VPAQFLGARGKPPRPRSKLEDLFSGSSPVLGFENAEKVEGAEFNDPLAVTHNDTPENRRLVAQQQAALVVKQAVWLLDDLDGGACAQIRLTKIRYVRPRGVENLIGPGRHDLDVGAVRL
jgi:hypothetical protein